MTEDSTACQHCRTPNPPQNRFCGHCGSSMLDTVPEYLIYQPTPGPEVLPVRTRIESGRLRAVLGKIGRPVALGALVLVAETLAEAGMMWLGQGLDRRAGGYVQAPSSSPEPTGRGFSGVVPLELKCYEELKVFAQDGNHVSRLFATRSVFGPPGGDG